MLCRADLKNKDNIFHPGFSGKGMVRAFSRRSCRNMSLCYGDTANALNNRRDFLSGLGIDYRDLVCAGQVHGSRIACVTQNDKGSGALTHESALADTDALITDRRNVPLAVFTADCLSVFLYSTGVPAIGLVHAGWRGTQAGIVARTVVLMREKFDLDMPDLSAFFGPAIRDCCYEVGQEFGGFFDTGPIKRGSRYYFDLVVENKKQLLGSGVIENNIFDCGICTFSQNEDYFSYRKEGASCGRMMSVIMLK